MIDNMNNAVTCCLLSYLLTVAMMSMCFLSLGFDRASLYKLLVYIWLADARTKGHGDPPLTPIVQVGCYYLVQQLWQDEEVGTRMETQATEDTGEIS